MADSTRSEPKIEITRLESGWWRMTNGFTGELREMKRKSSLFRKLMNEAVREEYPDAK